MAKLTRLSRRTVLKGLGGAIALPYLDIMATAVRAAGQTADPPRMVFFYIPGAILRPAWFPQEVGPNYTLPQTIRHIERHRDQFTMVSGTMHIEGQVGGHGHKLNFLTAHNVRQSFGTITNSISVDQVAAQHFGETYLPSLVMSFGTEGGDHGVTLSRNAQGADIPPVASPQAVFDLLFPPEDPARLQAATRRLALRKSILDATGEQARGLRRRLGVSDQRRVDEYLDSVREVERRAAMRKVVLSQPRPDVRTERLNLDFPVEFNQPITSMREWMEVMTDLIVLGFQTDMTRVVSYALGDEGTPGSYGREWVEWKEKFKPRFDNAHDMHHKGGELEELDSPEAQAFGARDALIVQCFGRMLDKLAAIPARDGTLLDHCQLLLGGAQDRTHRAVNFPLLVAGGKKLGWKHGQHVRYEPRKVPTSDLFLTMLQAAGCPVESFKESRGPLTELLV
jgi:hypothetical protein